MEPEGTKTDERGELVIDWETSMHAVIVKETLLSMKVDLEVFAAYYLCEDPRLERIMEIETTRAKRTKTKKRSIDEVIESA